MMRNAVAVWLLAALGPALVGCGSKQAESKNNERLPRVETVQPEFCALLPIRIEVSAMVEAMEKADLCARIPGVVESLRLDESKPEIDIGRRVGEGEPLLKLSVPELDAEKVNKEALLELTTKQFLLAREALNVSIKKLEEGKEQEKRYQAEHQQRRSKHERTLKLVQSGALQPEVAEETRSQLDAADSAWQAAKALIQTMQAQISSAEADLKVAESRIKVAKAEAQRLEVLVSYAVLRAPFDGVITRRLVDRGAMVKDSSIPLLTIMRTNKVRVLLDIPERDMPAVNATDQNPNPDGKGDLVILNISSLQERVPGGKFTGHISRMGASLDPTTRTMRAEVHLDNPDGYLRPGMYGIARVLLEERYKVLTVPSTALVRRNSKAELFHVEGASGEPPKGVARCVEVDLGVDDGARVQVRSGLTGQELIIAKGSGVIREGDRVIAIPLRQPEP